MKPLLLIFVTAALAMAEGQFDRTLRTSGPVDLDVTTDSGGITVSPGSADSIRIHAVIRAQRGWFGSAGDESRVRELERNPPVEQMGNRIRIGYVRDHSLLRGISIHYDIQTPPDTRLRARADSGGVRVEGLRLEIDCQTDSGGIEIRNAGSDVRATADSGGIRINNVAGAVTARVDSGGIDATDVAGKIDAHTDSGGIRLKQSKPAPIRADADSGGIVVTLASGAGYNLDVQAESGRISVPQLTSGGEISRHHVEGKFRGGGPPVRLSADSGTIAVN
jgi:hypothetical protein